MCWVHINSGWPWPNDLMLSTSTSLFVNWVWYNLTALPPALNGWECVEQCLLPNSTVCCHCFILWSTMMIVVDSEQPSPLQASSLLSLSQYQYHVEPPLQAATGRNTSHPDWLESTVDGFWGEILGVWQRYTWQAVSVLCLSVSNFTSVAQAISEFLNPRSPTIASFTSGQPSEVEFS